MNEESIRELLESANTIAVVGVSAKPERDSHRVAAYLQRAGFKIIPVNPTLDKVLGEGCYPNLGAVPADVTVDIVDVFRRPEAVPEIVEAAIERGAGGVWLQLGVTHPEAERQAADAGLRVVADRCIKVEHSRLIGQPGW